MRVVHIAYYYGLNNTGGAAIASTRMHRALLEQGVDSHYVCVHKVEEGQNVYQLPSGLARFVFLWGGKILRKILMLYHPHGQTFLCIIPLFGLNRLLLKLKPDVLHIHWLNADVMSLGQLAQLPFPIVFHLHDMWLFNGFNPVRSSDERFRTGFSPQNSRLLERWVWERKRRMVEALHPYFVSPSVWMGKICKSSIVGAHSPVAIIPNQIDSRVKYEAALRTNDLRFRILFGCFGGTKNLYKGWPDLVASLATLPRAIRQNMELHVFGEDADVCREEGVEVKFHGNINDPEDLRMLYHSADVFAFPSRVESFGMTKIEALLCGLPVIAFDRTACAEGVEHGVTGWVAPDGDLASYAEGIKRFYELWENGGINHADIGRRALAKFGTAATIRGLMNVYEQAQT